MFGLIHCVCSRASERKCLLDDIQMISKKKIKNVALVRHAAVNSFSASRITDFKSILNVCLKGQFIRYGQNFILNVQEVNYQLCEKTTVMRLCLKMSM